MNADLRPYQEYKDSGLPWLGLCEGTAAHGNR